MRNKRQKEDIAAWTKEQLEERKMRMEQLHPGYLDWDVRLKTWLGFVLIGRMFLHGVSIILGAERGIAVFLAPLNLLFCLGFYLICIRPRWELSWAFLILRGGELIRTLFQTLPSLLYLNFWGDLWWVTTITVLCLDISFLAAVAWVPSAHRFVENQRVVYSSQEI